MASGAFEQISTVPLATEKATCGPRQAEEQGIGVDVRSPEEGTAFLLRVPSVRKTLR